MSPNTINQLPQERIDALISTGIFHMNANNARDVDSICNSLAMQCLSGYALKPFFVDPAYATAIRIAYQEINSQRRILSDNLEIAQQHSLRYSFDMTPEDTRIEELMDHIHKLEDATREKTTSKAEKSSHKVKERASRTKRYAHKIPSGRATQQTPSSPIPSSSSAEETTPQIHKRKRSSPSRVISSVPKGIEQTKTAKLAPTRPALARPVPSIGQDDHLVRPTPSPDQDDHLPIKRLKTQHSQGSASHTQTPTQTPKPISPPVNTQHPSLVNS